MKNMKSTKRGKLSRLLFSGLLVLVGLAMIPAGRARAMVSSTGGWFGEYYGNGHLSGAPVLVRGDGAIDFDWGVGAAAAGLPADGFSARWTRFRYFQEGTYRFLVRSDDGVRVWLDGEVIIDQWHPSPGVTYDTDRFLRSGLHVLRVEYYEETGGAKVQFWWEKPSSPSYPDWKGEYYPNQSLDGSPVLVRNDDVVDFDWGKGSPSADLPQDRFSVRWSREARFKNGTYRFHARADGDVCVWVDDELVLDARLDGSIREFTADHTITGGTRDVKVEYFEGSGDARVRVWWEMVPSYPDWKGQYWDNRHFHGRPTLVRNDEVPVFDWGAGSPAAGLPADGFAVRWSHSEEFQGGVYHFCARASDGIRVYVDGALVLDEWHDSDGEQEYVAEVTLEGEHEVVVEYHEHKGEARVQFYWQRVGDIAPPIPAP
jgi:hypothetical protein